MIFLWVALSSFALVFVIAMLLTLVPRLGKPGRSLSDALCRAPLLDLVVASFTFAPWIPAIWFAGWLGFPAAVLGQMVALGGWVIVHEWMYREHTAGPRIVKFINRSVGRWRNHAALWVTALSLPAFWFIRAAQVLLYPFLVWLLKFPRYKQGEWVNCSRHKFEGLVGHDLIWCLYCDWMTGVYSLGAEMLRNVESFWCPIRFYDGKKCENCRVDFPDIDGGWVRENGTMAEVEAKMEEMYGDGAGGAGGRREWFGHPARRAASPTAPPSPSSPPVTMTVEGQRPEGA